jgi:HlyD family type I secretion membrane fusion protein
MTGTLSKPELRGPILWGVALVAVFFVAFGGWAAQANLESAAIAPGVVSVENERKTVQHLEGGIVSTVYVREGDDVSLGQVLVSLDPTQAESQMEFVRSRYHAALALEARLMAERDGMDEITFPPELVSIADQPDVIKILESQREIARTRKALLSDRVRILEQGIAEYQEELKGLDGQIQSFASRIASLEEDQRGVAELAAKGLVPQVELRELDRRLSELDGDRSAVIGRVSQLRQSVTESRLKINELQTSHVTAVVEDLREVQGEVFELRERLRASADVLARTEIRAPIDGRVVSLGVHTKGGVVAPGAPILEIVPSDDALIIEARIDPRDIDVLQVGQPAHVRFTAFNQRVAPPVEGTLAYLSADAFVNEKLGTTFYVAKIHLDPDSVSSVFGGKPLLPGMETEVLILTGARTPLDYLLEPLTRSMTRAMRES